MSLVFKDELFDAQWLRAAGHSAYGGAEINEAKKVLANEATAMLHGRVAAEEAAATARQTFKEGALAESLPTVDVAAAEFEAGLGALTLGPLEPRHVFLCAALERRRQRDDFVPSRRRPPRGARVAIHSLNFGSSCRAAVASVGKKPGAMALTVMRCGASSTASARTMPCRPALAVM